MCTILMFSSDEIFSRISLGKVILPVPLSYIYTCSPIQLFKIEFYFKEGQVQCQVQCQVL